MKRLLLLIAFAFFMINVNAQKLPWFMSRDTSYKYLTTYNNVPMIVLLIPGKHPVKFKGYGLDSIKTNEIESIDILRGEEANKKYGDDALYGVILIHFKKKTNPKMVKLNNIHDFYSKYKINESDQKLALFIDSNLIYHPDHQYFNFSTIKSVKIDTEFVSGIRFISATTINPVAHYKKGTILIR